MYSFTSSDRFDAKLESCWAELDNSSTETVCSSAAEAEASDSLAFSSAISANFSTFVEASWRSSASSSTAEFISFIASETDSVDSPIFSNDCRFSFVTSFTSSDFSLISLTPWTTSDAFIWVASIISLIFSVSSWVSSASSLTESATTAKPFPCSPALAASIDAFKANRLVCSAILDMVSIILPISSDCSSS